MTKDWELLKLLEYKGNYSCRYTCNRCEFYNRKSYAEIDYGNCEKLNNDKIKVSGKNNICKQYAHRIINPSVQDFVFDEYLIFLMNDFYRPYTINPSEIRGSAKLGEVILDGGKMARLLPEKYSFFYEYYDYPFCRLVNPLTTVKVDNHNFQLEYRLYRKCEWYENNIIKYIKHYWKDKPTQRKYHSEIYGEHEVE